MAAKSFFYSSPLTRVISGVAEAAVSGADEALAYDSLKAAGREDEWNQVLAKVQRYTSLAFFFAMMTGSAFYAHTFVNGLLDWMGTGLRFDEATLIKFPIPAYSFFPPSWYWLPRWE